MHMSRLLIVGLPLGLASALAAGLLVAVLAWPSAMTPTATGSSALAEWSAFDGTIRILDTLDASTQTIEYRGPYRWRLTITSWGTPGFDIHGTDVGGTTEYVDGRTRTCYPRFGRCLDGTIEAGFRQALPEWLDPATPALLATKRYQRAASQVAGESSFTRTEVIAATKDNCPPRVPCSPGQFDTPAIVVVESIRYRSNDGLPLAYTRSANGTVVFDARLTDLKPLSKDAPFAR